MPPLVTPQSVQRWLDTLAYNPRETMRALPGVKKTRSAHCLEAAMAAAVLLEPRGYPPLILDVESADLLDHTLFIFQYRGKWGAVGKSRDIGLDGRRPVFPTIKALVQSYAAPYIDAEACITGYGVLDMRTLKDASWRTSRGNVWYVEEALRNISHQPLRLKKSFITYWRTRYLNFKKQHPDRQPDFYPQQTTWW